MRLPWSNRNRCSKKTSLQPRRALLRVENLEGRTVPTVISPVLTEFQANVGVTHSPTTATTPSIGVDENGNFDVAFVQNTSATEAEIVVRRFKADGTPQATNATLMISGPAANNLIGSPKIAVRKDGTFTIVYDAPSPSGNFSTVYIRRYLANGTPNGALVKAALTGLDQRNQIEPSVAIIDANGAFYVTWTDVVAPGNGDIRGRGFNSTGTAINATDVAIATDATNEHASSVGARPNTSSNATAVVVSYTRDDSATVHNVFARRFNTSFVAQGSEVQVNTTVGAADQSSVAVDSTQNFVVVWTDSTNPADTNIKMRRYDSSGTPQTAMEESVDSSPGNQSQPVVAKAGDDGRFVVAYTDAGSGSNRVSFEEFSIAGVLQTAKRSFSVHTAVQNNPGVGASHNARFAIAADDNSTGQNEPWVRTFRVAPSSFIAVGAAPGRVRLNRVTDGSLFTDFLPFGSSYTGPVSVAWGDINGDGMPDLIVGATVGNPDVRVYDGKAFTNGTWNAANPDATRLAMFFPYALQFNVGANVAAGDVNGDGYADVITGATAGNPEVRVYSGKDIANGTFNPTGSSKLAAFFAYGLQFNVGAFVAAGDLKKDGYADIVTGATVGNPHVKVYSGKAIATGTFNPFNADASSFLQYFAFGQSFNIGASVAVGDTNGDGNLDIIAGASGGNPEVKVYNGTAIVAGTFNTSNPDANLLNRFFAFDLNTNTGAHVSVGNIEGNGKDDILTGATAGSPHYRAVKGNATGTKPTAVNGIDATPSNMMGGIYVAAL